MSSDLTAADVESAVRGLCVATATSLGVEITLPVMFPGGDMVSVVVAPEDSGYVVHDSSAAAMFLASMGFKLAHESQKKLHALVAKYGCELAGDRVIRRCAREQIAAVAALVANASRSIGDHAMEVRKRVEFDFREAVTDRIRSVVGKRVRTNEEVRGFSGRSYRVHNVILDAAERQPIAYIEPVATRHVVSSHFAQFYDIREAKVPVANIIVYDESGDVRTEDVRLLEKVGDVIPFASSRAHLESLGVR